MHLPFALASGHFAASAAGEEWWCQVEVAVATGRCGLRLYDALGQLLAVLEDFELRAAPPAAFQVTQPAPEWLTTLEWMAAPLVAAGDAFAPDSWLVVGETSELQAELVGQMQQTAGRW